MINYSCLIKIFPICPKSASVVTHKEFIRMGKLCFISGRVILVNCVFLVLYNNNFGSCQCTTAYWAPPIHGKKLITTPLSLETASDLKQCLLKCFTADGCVSFNFGSGARNSNVCELLKTDRHFLPSNFIPAAGWIYTGKKVGVFMKYLPRYSLETNTTQLYLYIIFV